MRAAALEIIPARNHVVRSTGVVPDEVSGHTGLNSIGDWDTSIDWEITDARLIRFRAERAATGTGRIYTITVRDTDKHGNTSTARRR